jgi:hypothetical protein
MPLRPPYVAKSGEMLLVFVEMFVARWHDGSPSENQTALTA